MNQEKYMPFLKILGIVLAVALFLVGLFICDRSTIRQTSAPDAVSSQSDVSTPAESRTVDHDPADGSASLSAPAESEFSAVQADNTDPYPDLYAQQVEKTDDNTQKIVYLTFDDGPSDNTEKILDVLNQYGVHATFFVTGQYGTQAEREERYQKILDSGNTIGLHTYSHNYEKIYQSTNAFLKDLNKIYQEVYAATGYRASLLRFPGGSVNTHNRDICKALTEEVERRGFTYHDWAVSCGDAEGKHLSASTILKDTVDACKERTKSVVLFHDTPSQDETVKALGGLIESLLDSGYQLRALDSSIKPFHFVLDES